MTNGCEADKPNIAKRADKNDQTQGRTPVSWEAADGNCDGVVDLGDTLYILNYPFKGGSEPSC